MSAVSCLSFLPGIPFVGLSPGFPGVRRKAHCQRVPRGTLLDRLQCVAQFLQLDAQEIKMQVTLRLIVLKFPQPLEDGRQFLLVRHGQVVGRCLGLRLRHTAERIIERMELIVQIIEGGIDSFPALGLAAVASIILVRLIIVSTPLAPFACVA